MDSEFSGHSLNYAVFYKNSNQSNETFLKVAILFLLLSLECAWVSIAPKVGSQALSYSRQSFKVVMTSMWTLSYNEGPLDFGTPLYLFLWLT